MAPAIAVLLLAAACGGARPAVAPAEPRDRTLLQFQRGIDAILAAPALARSSWGVAIDSLERDERVYAYNADKLLLPASNVKVVTLAAAAERLGWDYTFQTELYAIGPIDGGILYGDLVVVGSGDPSLDDWDGHATRVFAGWAAALEAAGITVVTGSVVGDDNRLPEPVPGPGWAWDDVDRSFAAAPGALQFNQNTTRLAASAGATVGAPALVTLSPPGTGLILRNLVTTAAADTPAVLQTRRAVESQVLDVSGSIPVGSTPLVRNVSAYNPTLYFANALREALILAGIEIRGPALDADTLSEPPRLDHGVRITAYRSPPLSALAVTMMKVSQNLFAESLLMAAGGIPAVRSALTEWGTPDGSLSVVDGSGLSRYNLATADALVRVLSRVYRDDRWRDRYVNTLPIAGRDGTLAGRMAGTAAEGNARAKTGAFSNARALSGYVTTADGEPIVFSIVANNFGTSADVIDAAADAIVVHVAAFSRRR
jgi:D-alanyl-D-alanine carboxypeptidase/D-alanyl-D-alanine-endopeptidase (penicillin-binding protein 4)